jgi:hypothetical protein
MTEQQEFTVIERRGDYEVRHYPEHLVAEVRLDSDFENAGTAAFRRLVSFIGGANAARRNIAMTAPVLQMPLGAEGGTASADRRRGEQVVSFVLPAAMTAQEPPVPLDPKIVVRRMPEERAAVVRFSGRWTWSAYQAHVEQLTAALARDGMTPSGPARFARFDPPWTPWFLRHNEVVIPVSG